MTAEGDLLVEFTVPGAPAPKQRPRRARHGRFYTPRPTTQAEDRVQAAARSAWAGRYTKPHTGFVVLEAVFWLPSKRRVDLDNLVKLVTDALMPYVLADDSQIWGLAAHKAFSRHDPRTEVRIYTLATHELVQEEALKVDTPPR